MLYCTFNLIICIINVVVIITQPINVTVCLIQSTTASFTCVVDRGGLPISNAGWEILDGERYFSVAGRDHHMIDPMRNGDTLTDTVTVTDVSLSDNGALYRCEPDDGVTSRNVTITVLGEITYNLFIT